MTETITVRFSLPAAAKRIYDAWLDGKEHSAMTGSPATGSARVGAEFTAWDGYIRGKNLLLIENQKIVQSWRSEEFPEEAADSVLSVRLIERQGLTEVEIEHSDIPSGHSVQFQSGWLDFYAKPMQQYFARKGPARETRQGGATRARPGTSARRKAPKRKSAPKKQAAAQKKVAKTKAKTVRVKAKRK